MNPQRSQRTALITGAAGGIGQALCAVFASAGYRVVATDVRPCNAHHDAFVALDLERFCEDRVYRQQAFSSLEGCLEGRSLEVLVNNAAVQHLAPTSQISDAQWRSTLNVNVAAPFLLVQGFLSHLELGRGAVINIGSVHARATKPGFVWYAASKAALEGLTRSLAVDLGGKVRVNAISPAATATPMLLAGFEGREEPLRRLADMHPMGRIAKPDEIAEVALFLASAHSGFLTGATIAVDGGISARLHDPE